MLSYGPGFKFWAPATYLLVTLGGQFTSLGLSVPICTMGTRVGLVDEAVEVKGVCEPEHLIVSKLEEIPRSRPGKLGCQKISMSRDKVQHRYCRPSAPHFVPALLV